MKAALLHIILFLYTVSVLKPVLPIAVDLFAHTFQELEHTASVHAHNGEQHVHLEMSQLATTEPDAAPAAKIDISVTPHFFASIELPIFAAPETKREWEMFLATFPLNDSSSTDPPPKN